MAAIERVAFHQEWPSRGIPLYYYYYTLTAIVLHVTERYPASASLSSLIELAGDKA